MVFDVLTLFPRLLDGFTAESLIGRAVGDGLLTIRTTDIRSFTNDRHNRVDDYPFGGGSGMLMTPEPIFRAHEHVLGLESRADERVRTIYLSPAGSRLDQNKVTELANWDRLILLCGRYEGVDQRVIDALVDEEISIGDYVLFGGELPAMVLMEAVSRYVPGVMGNRESLDSESFSTGLLEYPQYTKPRSFRGMDVPEVLLSGDHARIAQWRREKALEKTGQTRPDLLKETNNTNTENR